ncbi:MAG: hypothetical protein DMF59_20475, partial [Acidobacteria bacterium]
NVSGQNVYRRGVHGYAVHAEDATYSEELIGLQRFFEQRDVDYPFQSAPDSVSVDANSSHTVKKVSFNAAKDVDLRRFALIRLREGKADEAKKAIDRAVINAPCEKRLPKRRIGGLRTVRRTISKRIAPIRTSTARTDVRRRCARSTERC